jgi:DNA repair exonuclease SbcCD ATPase subunit
MSVDISKLSSKELFELAKRREQEEQEANKRQEHLKAAQTKREELIKKHEGALAATDKAIKELKEKREKQVADFEAALVPVEQEIKKLERLVKEDIARSEAAEPPPKPAAAAPVAPPSATKPAAPKTPAAVEGSTEELYGLIRNMMRNRSYISESLLKENLKSAGFETANLRKQLEQLMREGRLDNKGRGNYALGKRK